MKDNKSFFLIWAGQTVSILGSSLSGFALGVWIYQKTGSASQFALVALCTALPQMLVSPFAGVVVDRFNRRKIMAFSDGGAALCTLALAGLFISGQIQVIHIYLLTACSSACNAVQAPAYSALVATIIKRDQLGRANGLVQFGRGLAEILAPTLAGLLVLTIKVPGILAIDLGTFCFAIFTLAVVQLKGQDSIPQTDITSRSNQPHWLAELRTGWQTLRAQPELAILLRYQLLFSFLWSLFGVLVMPMVLGFSDSKGLGLVLTLAGAGLLTGSLILSAWGGPKRRLTGILAFELLSALAFCLMGSRPILLLVMIAAFAAHFTLAFVSGLNEAIWQASVESAMQGRIFAFKQTAVKAATLLAYLTAGGLADRVLEPLLRPGGAWTSSLGAWFGVGSGRGLAALFLMIGVVKAASVLAVYFSPATRYLNNGLVGRPETSPMVTASSIEPE